MANNRLVRDKEHAMLGGVCAGIANRVALDQTIVRVVTIALAVVSAGTALILYAALWIIMPAGEVTPHRPSRDEITDEIRDAADRVREAAQIVTAAAKQAADEIAQVQGRRRDSGATDVPADVASAAAPPSAGAADQSQPDQSSGGQTDPQAQPPR
ncbi:MAG: PspC domain-containing protein [Chloroflexi bacterium]|nr:PspC domain-containing protein [Chloroflexota bacterium]